MFNRPARSERHLRVVGWLALVLLGPCLPPTSAFAEAPPYSAIELADPEAIEKRLRDDVKYLASDELEGRGIRTVGIDKAADHIAAEFRRLGLDTEAYDGTPFQEFDRWSRLEQGTTNSATLRGPDEFEVELNVDRDFRPLSLSGSGQFDLPLVFAGYGITAKNLGYDDYADLDVKGKAVIVLRREPQQADPQSPFDGTRVTRHAWLRTKIANAVAHGAAAVILCSDGYTLHALAENAGAEPEQVDELLKFRLRSESGERTIPVMHCRRKPLDALLRAAVGEDLAALERTIDEETAPQSRALEGCRIGGEVSVMRRGRAVKNVIGILNGEGPLAHETLVIGAHYDHLGYGGWGSLSIGFDAEIHNGADDNASGTATMLEIARRLALRKQPPKRRVVFIAFSAEESGLIGSAHYVRDPIVPLDHTVAMLNLDMVGRLTGERLTVYGTGTAREFDPLIDRLTSDYEFRTRKRPGGNGPSDHASFHGRGIPVMHFFTWLHRDYHRPGDDWEKLNYEGMRRIAGMVTDAAEFIVDAGTRPTKTRPGNGSVDVLADVDIASPEGVGQAGLGATRPWLGMGVRSNDDGLWVSSVAPKSPAFEAGLRTGDVLLEFGGEKIDAETAPSDLLAERKLGDVVPVVVRRKQFELELELTVGGR